MDALTPTQRTHKHRRKWGPAGKEGFDKGNRSGGQESFIDLYNRLGAQYGTTVTDLMLGGPFSPFAVFRALSHIWDDLDLWFEATRQRVLGLRPAERLGLECWLWETHDRSRNPDRWKPNKSTAHDAPWPEARNWSPRRWFGPCPAGPPLTISIIGAADRREMLADVKGAAEGGEAEYADDARCNAEGQWLTVRKALEPGWLWNDVPVVNGFPKWKKQWGGWGWVPYYEQRRLKFRREWYGHKWSPRYEQEVDEAPPDSVLRQTHEPPASSEPLDYNLQRRLNQLDRWQEETGKRLHEFPVNRKPYWATVKGRPLGVWSTPKIEDITIPIYASPALHRWNQVPVSKDRRKQPAALGCWWEVKAERPYRYWENAGSGPFPTKPKRPSGATYEIDLVCHDAPGTAPIEPSSHNARKPLKREMLLRFAFIGGGSHFGEQPFFVSMIASDVRSRLPSDEYPHRTVTGERLRSPYYPRGIWSYRSKHWVPDNTPNKRSPGAWALQHVEAPAAALSAKRTECCRRREAAIDGLLSNFGCDDTNSWKSK